MDLDDCDKKDRDILNDTNTYEQLVTDSTEKFAQEVRKELSYLKGKGEITDQLYKRFYPHGCTSRCFYGLPKIHNLSREDPIPKGETSGVYRIPCSCGLWYIGRTDQQLTDRLTQHSTSINSTLKKRKKTENFVSALGEHIFDHPEHTICSTKLA